MSAEEFAGQNSIWHGATPTLEQFTRWANQNARMYAHAVPVTTSPSRSALIAECAFQSLARGLSIRDVEPSVRKHLVSLPRGESSNTPLLPVEAMESQRLRDNIESYVSPDSGANVIYNPLIAGSGGISDARADVIVDTQLIEVKAVARGYRGLDFRQMLTYAALLYGTAGEVDTVTLLNPRAGSYFGVSCRDLSLDVGSGSWVELAADLVESMSGLAVSD